MMTDPNPSNLGPVNEDELKALELEWDQGHLVHHVERLLAFVVQQRDDILRLAEGRTDAQTLLHATKRLIVCLGAVHPKSEMLDQIGEMQRELWYCGEKGDYDLVRIKHEWTSKHARNWRRWRLTEYLFTAD